MGDPGFCTRKREKIHAPQQGKKRNGKKKSIPTGAYFGEKKNKKGGGLDNSWTGGGKRGQ